jgi:hypothetical protein
VLLNQSHTYPDLYLAIDVQEKRLFEAIDGRRTIAQIVHTAASGGASGHHHKRERDSIAGDRVARDFFERLWCYDQVVFDASQPRERETSDQCP